MSKKQDDKFIKQCKSLGKRMQKELTGEDVSVGMNALVMCLANVIIDCCRDGEHLSAFTQTTKHLMTVLIKESPTMQSELEAAAIPMEAIKDMMLSQLKEPTKH